MLMEGSATKIVGMLNQQAWAPPTSIGAMVSN
uniref:Uncharacterized protein n=1 Tax=Arundo donax TaxID=35708 RepID=A0A0A9BV34_ARUDO